MDRRHFIATVGVASAAVAASAVLEENWAQAEPRRDPDKRPPAVVDERFLDTLTKINDLQVPATLAGYQAQIDTLASPRGLAQSAMRLVSAYVNPRGANHHRESLLGPLATLLRALAERQNPSGLYDIGNLDSPPDTSFAIGDMGLSYVLLADDDQPATVAVRAQYAAVMRKAGTALAEGGVHTPNHRWEICKALAHLHHLWPSRLLKARINDWLGEGIDQDGEGEYSERSPNYASEVTNKSLLTVARYLDKPRLRDNVRRNLQLTLYRIQPNGEIETVQSRRQDQVGVQDVWKYLTHYRELAIRDRNGQFAAVASEILDRVAADLPGFATSGYSVGEFLAEALAYPDITAALPTSTPVPTTYTKVSKGSQLVSLRRGSTTAAVFGGTDWHNKRVDSEGQSTSIREIASGLSTNPTFFKYRKGAAILDSVRLSPRFFSTGHFRSDGVASSRGGWRLQDEVAVAYHLPLPQRRRRSDGNVRARLGGSVLLEDGLPAPAQGREGADDDDHDHRGRHRWLRPRLRPRRTAHLADHRALLPFRWHPHGCRGGDRRRELPAGRGGGHVHGRGRHDHLRARHRQRDPATDRDGRRREVHLPRWQPHPERPAGLPDGTGPVPLHPAAALTGAPRGGPGRR